MILYVEIIRAVILGILFSYLLLKSRGSVLLKDTGWKYILIGFGLLFLGSVVDITDEFPSLSFLIVVGDTNTQAIIEKIIGYSFGSIFVFWGSAKFIPIILKAFAIEKELKKTNEVLEVKVKKRTEELETASNVKSEFIAIMSHEIRTPLNSISGMTHLLKKTGLDSKQDGYIKRINTSVNQLLSIFNNILDYSDLDSGKTQLREVVFNSEQLFAKIFHLYQPLATEKGLTLEIKTKSSIPKKFRGDEILVSRIVKLVIDNAVKFTDHGSVKVSIEYIISKKFPSLNITVTDTGIGISEDNIDGIIGYFTQLEKSATRKHGGIGLGLALCNKLVLMLNGSITVKSKLEEGSSFEISIPLESGSEDIEEYFYSNEKVLNNNKNEEGSTNKIDLSENDKNNFIGKLNEIKTHLENYDADSLILLENMCSEWANQKALDKAREKLKKYLFDDALDIINNLLNNLSD